MYLFRNFILKLSKWQSLLYIFRCSIRTFSRAATANFAILCIALYCGNISESRYQVFENKLSNFQEWLYILAITGVRPKGAGGASAPPMKNNSACRNENRAIVGTGMNILSEQKLEVCCNHQKLINCQTSLELDISKFQNFIVLISSLCMN